MTQTLLDAATRAVYRAMYALGHGHERLAREFAEEEFAKVVDVVTLINEQSALLDGIRSHLTAIMAYEDDPGLVCAFGMTADQKVGGMWSQAAAALALIDQSEPNTHRAPHDEIARLRATLEEIYFVADAPGEDIRATVDAALGR